MPGGEVADAQRDPGEPPDLRHLSLREEPVGDPPLIEHLDRPGVQTARARAREVQAGAPLDDGHVDPGQRQLARQHQPRRTASGDHHRMLGHGQSRSFRFRRFDPASGVIRHDPGLAASPPVTYTFEVERGARLPAPPALRPTSVAAQTTDAVVGDPGRRSIATVPFTLRNLKEDLEDVGARFDGSPDLEFRLATDALELEQSGLSLQRIPPGYRFPYGHTHETQEEVYVVVRGSGRMKLDDEIVELEEWDAVRVPPGTWRGYEAGPEGLVIMVIGAPSLGEARRDDVEGQRDWWAD